MDLRPDKPWQYPHKEPFMSQAKLLMAGASKDHFITLFDEDDSTSSQTYLAGVFIDSSDNIYAMGYVQDINAGSDDHGVLDKLSSDGTLVYRKEFYKSGDSFKFFGGTGDSTHVYCVGTVSGQGSGQVDALLISVPHDGSSTEYSVRFGQPYNDAYTDAALDNSGDVVCVGNYRTSNSSTPPTRGTIHKRDHDSNGDILFDKTYQGTNLSNVLAVACDGSDNVYFTGYFDHTTSSYDNVLFVGKLNSSGVEQFAKMHRSSENDYGYGIALDSSGNIYVVGATNNYGLIIKYNSSGVVQWDKILGESGSTETFRGVVVDANDDVYVAGTSNSPGSTTWLVAKYNSSGAVQWQRTLGTSSSDALDSGSCIKLDSSENVIVAGQLKLMGAIAKLKNDGSGLGTYTFGISGGDVDVVYQASSLTEADISMTSSDDTQNAIQDTSDSISSETMNGSVTVSRSDFTESEHHQYIEYL